MAYRFIREQGGPERVVARLAAGMGAVENPVEVQLGVSVRCVLKTLYTFDMFGESFRVAASRC